MDMNGPQFKVAQKSEADGQNDGLLHAAPNRSNRNNRTKRTGLASRVWGRRRDDGRVHQAWLEPKPSSLSQQTSSTTLSAASTKRSNAVQDHLSLAFARAARVCPSACVACCLQGRGAVNGLDPRRADTLRRQAFLCCCCGGGGQGEDPSPLLVSRWRKQGGLAR